VSRRTSFNSYRIVSVLLALLGLLVASSCLPRPTSETGGINITLYGFSIMKEPLEKAIYPAFTAKWKQEHGQDIHFTSSFAGSETVTNQILQGVKAEIAILSIERDAERLKKKGFVTSDWHELPQKGIVNKTPFVIIVRKGNPKGIRDFSDLAKPGIRLIHPDPISSGGAQWSILAIYGSELVKADKQQPVESSSRLDNADARAIAEAHALELLKLIWRNVFSTPASAREARTTFELGNGDALVTYELDALLMMKSNSNADAEIVIPEATIFSEHPAVIVDRNVSASERPVVEAFMQYLWTEEAQRAFVRFHFRSSTNEALNQENKDLATIKLPFYVDYFGGWDKAYPDVIEHIFRDQVQKRK